MGRIGSSIVVMAFVRKIETQSLLVNGKPVHFALKKIQDVLLTSSHVSEVPHRHDFYTVIWIQKGSGNHRIDTHVFPVIQNSLFFIHPEQVHQLTTSEDSTGIALLFTHDFLVENGIIDAFMMRLNLFHEKGAATRITVSENDAYLQNLRTQMEQFYVLDDTFRSEKLSALLKLFLIYCSELAKDQLPAAWKEMDEYPKVVNKFKKLVDQKYSEWHKVNQYAEKLLTSPNYLNELVKKHTGRSAKAHIRNRLVSEAKRLAYFTHLSNKEIGFQLGFNDPSHFAKFLRQFVLSDNI
ncbi:MAG: helix-turn-helix domain-containing protein [Crocinitomicaceae bacterium]|nr:MAG: helix-turn-helix domain-containing protein [Crocinitomicaceae bacterium]